MRHFVCLAALLCLGFSSALAAEVPLYLDKTAPRESRITDLLSRMTLEEKVALIGGDETGFATKSNARLGIPRINMTDGPLGVRTGQATAFPSAVALASSFNPALAHEAAVVMATETRALGFDLLLGPCIGIARNPFNGRNFESYGEDPFLTSLLAQAWIRGLQGQGVLASTKHFAVNDQEHKRFFIDTIVDERTLHEIHLPAFQAAVEAGTWSVMSAYNKVNGYQASENRYLLTEVLKEKWGFQGFVVSDWISVHSTVDAANNGLDLEMPTSDFFDDKLVAAVRDGRVSEATIDDKVRRLLRASMAIGHFDNPNRERPSKEVVGSADHLALARKIAAQGLVLLKNDSVNKRGKVLPLDAGRLRKVALLGPGAFFHRAAGGGSSLVTPTRETSPLEAFRAALPNAQVNYAPGLSMRGDFVGLDPLELTTESGERGLRAEYFANMELAGEPAVTRVDDTINFDWGWNSPADGLPFDQFSARWTGYWTPRTSGEQTLIVRSDDGVRLFIDDELVLDSWVQRADTVDEVKVKTTAGQRLKIRMEYFESESVATAGLGLRDISREDRRAAVALAAEADVAVVFVGMSRYYEGEGIDRTEFALPEGQDELVRAVLAANKNTIVVMNGGNPAAMPWIEEVPAVVMAWFPGQEGAFALVDNLLGRGNFTGKLPVSFPKRLEDAPAFGHYPEDQGKPDQVTYGEGIFVGYRHFDSKGVEPLFPFGHGVSYTNFRYSGLAIRVESAAASAPKVVVEFDVRNVGRVAGAEVAQLYVRDLEPKVARPYQELKGFERVALKPGEVKRVRIELNHRSFAYYDVASHDWKVDPSKFAIRVGSSSRDIRLGGRVELR